MEKNISKTLIKLRKDKRLSQMQLGDLLGMSRSKVSSWEVGRRDLSVIDAIIISDYFQISLDVLLNPSGITTKKAMDCMVSYIENDSIPYEEKIETIGVLEKELKQKELINS